MNLARLTRNSNLLRSGRLSPWRVNTRALATKKQRPRSYAQQELEAQERGLSDWRGSSDWLRPLALLSDPLRSMGGWPFQSLWDFTEQLPNQFALTEGGRMWSPRVDMYDTKDAIVIEAELPGITKDEVKMKIKDGHLEITGERKIEKTEEDKEKNWKRIERSYGAFLRRIQLPKGTNEKDVKATFDKGVLKVSIPHPKTTQGEEGQEIPIQEHAHPESTATSSQTQTATAGASQ